MLDTPTKKRIDDCRDILVGKLPDPKAQIEQITIGLIYKFMDDMDKEAVELGGKAKFFTNYSIPDPANPGKEITVEFEKYSWDRLFDAKVTASEMLTLYAEAIAGMDKNPNIPQLFRDIFKNAFLPYRDPETLKMFLKTIGEFEYTHSEKLGDAFEYLLSVMGSQGDAGQFRTPRHIIDFLVAVVNPGKTDTILDPACGTAGFLISAFKYMMGDDTTPDERRRIISNFTGYDISPDMVRLSLVNLYLHGFSVPHIWEYDTLSSEDRWNETFDVILANPPFMSPKGGIRPHKKFSIGSNRSEVLFVDYIAEHLNPKGRAGIIVPEGVIFQSGTAYKALRKMLVDNYLYAVVSLPAGIFNPYSGVKTSILLMDKQLAKQTDEILFVKIDNDGYGLGAQRNAVKGGQLDEAIEIIRQFVAKNTVETQCIASLPTNTPPPANPLAHAVTKAEIAKNGDYNLSGERYRPTFVKGTIWNTVSLNDIVEYTQLGLVKSKTEQGEKSELYPYSYIKMDSINWNGQLDLSRVSFVNATDEELQKSTLDDGDFIYNTRNAPNLVGKCSVYHGKSGEYIFNNNILRVKFDRAKANPDFINRILVSDNGKKQVQSLIAGTTSVAAIYQKEYLSLQIPLPPLAVQQEIVAEIEAYQKIIDGAKMVVENYRPKIEIDPEWKMVELGSHCKIKGGSAFKSEDYIGNGVQLIRMGNVKRMFFDFDNSPSFLPKDFLNTYPNYILERGDLLISMTGTVGKEDYGNVCKIDNDGKFLLNQRVGKFEIHTESLNREFLYYFANSDDFRKQLFSNTAGGVRQANISNKGIESIIIPLPPLETQRRIVAQIEKEQELVNANKQLIAIFEQKIKDRVARVWGTAETHDVETHDRASLHTTGEPGLSNAAEPAAKYSKKAE